MLTLLGAVIGAALLGAPVPAAAQQVGPGAADANPASQAGRSAPGPPRNNAQTPLTKGMHVSRVILLGTGGGPRLRTKRSQIATLLMVDGRPYLIDAGFGVVQRLTAAGVNTRFIDRVFITHNHSDHSGGLGELYNFIWTDRGQRNYQPGPVQVIGPKGTKEVSDGAVSMLSPSTRIFGSQFELPTMSSIIDAREIKKDGVVYSDDLVTVTAIKNNHYGDFLAGSAADRSGDSAYSLRFETPAGSIVFTGDIGMDDALVKFAQNADLLVSEVSLTPSSAVPAPGSSVAGGAQRSWPVQHGGHMSPEEVGYIASQAEVSMVLLNHIVPGLDPEHDMSAYSTGVMKRFKGPVIVGQDLLEVDIAKEAKELQ